MNINLLVISIVWGHRGWPVYWEELNKKGNSNFNEQRQAFSKVLPLLQDYSVVVLGDREFCSVRLGRWLKRKKVDFCLRLKSNEHVEIETDLYTQFSQLGLSPGMQFYFEGVRVTKQVTVSRVTKE